MIAGDRRRSQMRISIRSQISETTILRSFSINIHECVLDNSRERLGR